MIEKNDDTVVIHLPREKRIQFERLAEKHGCNKSEFGRQIIDEKLDQFRKEFEFMKSIFDPDC